MKLPADFYLREDPCIISKELLGKTLFSRVDDQLCCGIIVETEAYMGPVDRGSHAWNLKRTPRNEIMYSTGGVVYMYICYGIHDMLNVVTGPAETPHAVLIRAVEPLSGIEIMRERRGVIINDFRLCQGPGALAKAFGLQKIHNGLSLQHDTIWIEEGAAVEESRIVTASRVGLNIEEPYKSIPWRYYIKGNKFVSKPRT